MEEFFYTKVKGLQLVTLQQQSSATNVFLWINILTERLLAAGNTH